MDRDALLASVTSLEHRREELLKELDSVSLNLKAQRAEYSRLLNEDALIFRLPNELLTGIFIDACTTSPRARYTASSSSSTPFQVTLSHVSQRWRELALCTPLLWNTINFVIRPMNHVQGRILARLQIHLARSEGCFLDITLNFHIVDKLWQYFELLLAHSTRWRRLSILTKHEQLDDVHNLLQVAKTPMLEHLSLNLGKPQEGSLSPRVKFKNVSPSIFCTGMGAPQLRFVRLAGLALGNAHPPTTHLTTLHLDGWTRNYMTHEQFNTIFQATPALVNLSLNQLCIHHPRDPLELPLPPVTLPHLLALRIHGPCSPMSRLVKMVNMPVLESLSLQSVDTFEAEVMATVRSLSLDSCAFDDLEIANLVRVLPNIESLSVDESMPDIFTTITPYESSIHELASWVGGAGSAGDGNGSRAGDTRLEPWRWPLLQTIAIRELQMPDVGPLCNMVFLRRNNSLSNPLIPLDPSLSSNNASPNLPLLKLILDRRSRTVLRGKHRLEWLQEWLVVESQEVQEAARWPPGLGYVDSHDLME